MEPIETVTWTLLIVFLSQIKYNRTCSQDTQYGSGTTRVVGVTETEHHEFVYVDGVMSSAEYDDDEGKGGWGGGNPNSIEDQPYYGLTVEELIEKLENQGYTVTIN